jgi:hypothetical protein
VGVIHGALQIQCRTPIQCGAARKDLASAALFSSAILGGSPAAAQATEVALVEEVSGRVIAFSQGKPALLETLDTINDRTQLDLPANSEVRVCHYQAGKIVSLKGPLRATVSRDGVTVENSGKAGLAMLGPCAAPLVSTSEPVIIRKACRGGHDARGRSEFFAGINSAPKAANL